MAEVLRGVVVVLGVVSLVVLVAWLATGRRR